MNLSKKHIFFFAHLIQLISAFEYRNEDSWVDEYPLCGGSNQSPINISEVKPTIDKNQKLIFENYDEMPIITRILNNGYTVEVESFWEFSLVPRVIKDGKEYRFVQMHFHWGSSNDGGSEHIRSKFTSPLEVHMVHWNYDLGDFDPEKGEGILVVGVLFEVDKDGPDYLWNIADHMHLISEPNSKPSSIWTFPLSQVINSPPSKFYLTYTGSLTTPPCSEGVTWVIPSKLSTATEYMVNSFREAKLKNGEDHNNRPIQPLNGRQIIAIRA